MKFKLLVRSAAAMLMLAVGTAQANPNFNTLFGCFAYVHDGCYVGTDSPCSEEDYNLLLDGCYGHFPAQVGKPRPINKLILPNQQTTQTPAYRAKIMKLKHSVRR